MRFRGREIAHLDQGRERLLAIAERLKDLAAIDDQSRSPGRQIHIVLAPIKAQK